MCGNVLYVSVQQPIILSRLDRASRDESAGDPAQLEGDEAARNEDSSDADMVETVSRALSTSIWIEHCRQMPSVELHAVYTDPVSDQSS